MQDVVRNPWVWVVTFERVDLDVIAAPVDR